MLVLFFVCKKDPTGKAMACHNAIVAVVYFKSQELLYQCNKVLPQFHFVLVKYFPLITTITCIDRSKLN